MAERDIYTIDIQARNQQAKDAFEELKRLAKDIEQTSSNLTKETGNKRAYADLIREMTEVEARFREMKGSLEDELNIKARIEVDNKSTQAMRDSAVKAQKEIQEQLRETKKAYAEVQRMSMRAFTERERETGQKTRFSTNFANYRGDPNRTRQSLLDTQENKRDIVAQRKEALRIGRGAISSKYINNSNAKRYEQIQQELLSPGVQGGDISKIVSGTLKNSEVDDNSLRGRLLIRRDEAQSRFDEIEVGAETARTDYLKNRERTREGFHQSAGRYESTISRLEEKEKETGTLTPDETMELLEAQEALAKKTDEFTEAMTAHKKRYDIVMDSFRQENKDAEKVVSEVNASLNELDVAAKSLSEQMTQIQGERITQKADRGTPQGRIYERAAAIGLAAVGAAVYSVGSRFSRGKQTVTSMREESLDVGYRTGDYDFRGIRQDYMEQGAPQGWSGQDMLAFSDTILNSLGYVDDANLRGNMQSMADFSKFSGAGQETSTAFMETMYRSGAVSTAEQARAIQEGFVGAIKASGMEGREREQLEALTAINDNMAQGREMSDEEVRGRMAMAAVLSGTGDRAFQGQNLAQFNMSGDEAIRGSDPFSSLGMLLGVGSDEQFAGRDGMYEIRRMMDEGLTPENFNTIIDSLTNMVGTPENVAVELQRLLSPGTSVESLRNLVSEYPNGIPIDTGDAIFDELGITGSQELDTREQAYMDSADQTAQAQAAHREKLESLLNDNKMMDAVTGLKGALDEFGSQSAGRAFGMTMATGLISGITGGITGILGTTLGTVISQMISTKFLGTTGGGIGSALLKMVPGSKLGSMLGLAGPAVTGQLPTFGGQAATAAAAKGGGAMAGGAKVAGGGLLAKGGMMAKGLAAKGGSMLTALAPVAKVLGPIATMAYGAYQVSQSDDKVHETGKQAGKWGGMWAGMKAGGTAGTLVGGPLGTLIGGAIGAAGGYFAGGKLGDWLGGKASEKINGTEVEPEVDPEVNVKGAYTENLNTITSQEEKATTTEKLHAEQMREDNVTQESNNLSVFRTLLNDTRRLLQISAQQNGIIGHLTGLSSRSGTGGMGTVGDGDYWSNANLVKHDLGQTSNQLTAEGLNSWINSNAGPDSVMRDMGEAFMEAGRQSGLDPRYLVAHAAHETGWGTSSIARNKGNMYGIGAFDSSPYESAYGYDGTQAGIIEGAKWIKENYYNRGETDLSQMNERYATDPEWADKIARTMRGAEKHTAPSIEINTNVNYSGTGNPEADGEAIATGINQAIQAEFRQERIRA